MQYAILINYLHTVLYKVAWENVELIKDYLYYYRVSMLE